MPAPLVTKLVTEVVTGDQKMIGTHQVFWTATGPGHLDPDDKYWGIVPVIYPDGTTGTQTWGLGGFTTITVRSAT